MLPVCRADSATLPDALSLQLQRLPAAERSERVQQMLEASRRGEMSLDDCFLFRERGRVIGVITVIRQKDGTVFVWPAEVSGRISPPNFAREIRAALYAQARAIVDEPSSWIGQALLDQDQRQSGQEMSENGFPRLTELVFMHRSLTKPLEIPAGLPPVESIPFDENSNRARFIHTLNATYINTLDCPEVTTGLRTADEALDGHKLTGIFNPQRWRLYQSAGQDVGLLLMSEHSPEKVWEIVYFGIDARFRGRGLGLAIMLNGLSLAQQSGTPEAVLAVDIRNTYAIQLYRRLAFEEFDRRIVHARISQPQRASTHS